jgi:hypothetical protein
MKTILSLLLVCLCLSSFGQVTNRFAFPALAGLRLREANITPGTNDSGNSPMYGIAANYYDQDYYWTNAAGPSGDEWDHWIVPQVLAAKAAGANCVRLMWDATAFVGDSTHHGAAAWIGTNTYSGMTNEIGMLASLCQSNGMYLYPSCTESRVLDVAGTPTNILAMYISNFCAAAVSYPNVFAIDVVQEADGTANNTNSFVAKDCNLWISAAHAGMTAAGRTVPVTCSLNGAGNAGDLNLVNRWQAYNLAAAGVDFLDVHSYYQYSIQDFYQSVTNRWGLPIVFAETGINMNGIYGSGSDNESTHPYGSELRQDFFFAAAQATAQQPYFQLTGVWAIAPNWLTNEEDWGLYGGAQSSTFALTNSRDQLRNFAMFPTNVQPANYSWSVCCTGVNTSALNYNHYTRYAVGSGMLDVSSNYFSPGNGVWQRQNNLVQSTGGTNTWNGYADGCQVLWQTSLPNTLGQTVQFDIPPVTYNSLQRYLNYVVWEVVLRGQAAGDYYVLELTSDVSGTYDNSLALVVHTSIGQNDKMTNIQYGSALDLTKWWRVTATASTNSNPTTITCTVSNMTSGVAMSPPLVYSGSDANIQSPGGMGLCAYLGIPNYTNIIFTAISDTVPTVSTPPSGTTNGTSVALSWPAASMGSGTINYTPQYVVTDFTTNFPSVNTWTSAAQTTGTSETITGVPANTNVIFRVMTSDSTGATNYSPWQVISTGGAGSAPAPMYLPFRLY